MNGQVERVIPILDAAANDDAAPRPAVGFQAGIQVGCAAGVQECGRAVFEQFGNRQERGGEFVLGGHRALQAEHIGQVVGSQVVGEQAAHGVGVADVHMPVDEARRKHHSRAVDYLPGRDIRQRGSLAHLGDAPAPYDYGAVGDNAPFRVHSDDVAGACYLEGVVRHFPCSSPMVAPPDSDRQRRRRPASDPATLLITGCPTY